MSQVSQRGADAVKESIGPLVGPYANGKLLALHAGIEGSTPSGSTIETSFWFVGISHSI